MLQLAQLGKQISNCKALIATHQLSNSWTSYTTGAQLWEIPHLSKIPLFTMLVESILIVGR